MDNDPAVLYNFVISSFEMMKILLIQPPVQDFYQTPIRTQPIGLCYLAASLRSEGHEVEILDAHTRKGRSLPVPSELSYLKEYYPFDDRSPFKLYSGYYHFGMGWEEVQKRIETSGADLFGISSSFTPYHEQALTIARIIKQWDRRKIVVLGGSHASSDPAEILESPWVDYVIMGEGEVRFPHLIRKIEQGGGNRAAEIDGIGYRESGGVSIHPLRTFIQDLDALPHPARELLDLDRYRIKKKRSTMVLTSRGCPHGCAYCSAHLVMGGRFRSRSPEAVLDEMVDCRNRHGIEVFDFEDDNFTFDQVRAKSLMRLIVQTFGEGKVELTAMNGISFTSLDRDLLESMKKAGFRTINLPLVSSDPLTKESMRRPTEKMAFDQILREAERVGLDVIAYAILGMPGQPIEEMVDSLITLMGKRVLLGPSVYYPTPGTSLFHRCREEGVLPPHRSQWRSTAFPVETESVARLDTLTLFRLARVINLVKGKMDKKEVEEGLTWGQLSQVLKAASREKLVADGPSDREDPSWVDLFLLLLSERSFFSLRKGSGKACSVWKEKSSTKVLDCFFDRAWHRPILRSRCNEVGR